LHPNAENARAVYGALQEFGAQLDAATSIRDLAALPGNRFETLSGDRKGQFSIRVNDRWRICFEWPDGDLGPSNVEIVDYH
jgi:proteic killer suppression protein